MMREALQAYLMQRVSGDGVVLDPAKLLYLATRAGAEAMGLADEIGDFAPGKAADLVYFRPDPGSVLAAAFDRAQSAEDKLAALFAFGGECVREVRVEGDTVFRSSAS
jgi:guanine deaminase